MELGRYLNMVDWSILDLHDTCEGKNKEFTDVISTGLNLLKPEKMIKFYHNDPPWITDDFKCMVKKRQQAFSTGNITAFKFYRNKVNKMRKRCRINYYACKVNHLKQTKPKECMVKKSQGHLGICEATSPFGIDSLVSHLQIDNLDQMSPSEIANTNKDSFLDSMKEFCPLNDLDLQKLIDTSEDISHVDKIKIIELWQGPRA
jgi:hypothetical protein